MVGPLRGQWYFVVMFRGEQGQRSHRQNLALAGALALVAGMVNTLGFLEEGLFTSHVTGHAGQLSLALVLPEGGSIGAIAARLLAFLFGAFCACVAIEGPPVKNKAYIYSLLLIVEAALLLDALVAPPRLSLGPLSLFTAMGLQNGLVTRLSGAVVRTTHLTGVVTDLGIEAARWGLLLLELMTRHFGTRGGRLNEARPNLTKSLLLLTILVAFLMGGALAASLFVRVGGVALLAPITLLLVGGALAFRNGMQSLGPENRK